MGVQEFKVINARTIHGGEKNMFTVPELTDTLLKQDKEFKERNPSSYNSLIEINRLKAFIEKLGYCHKCLNFKKIKNPNKLITVV